MKNKNAVITGASSGIGKATAIEFAKNGANVALLARRKNLLLDLKKTIESFGIKALAIECDVENPASVKEAFAEIKKEFGHLDYAFNNAGIEGEVGKFAADQLIENYTKVFDINVRGVLISMQEEIKLMTKGSIINTSSVAGSIGLPGMSIYVASKHAVNGLTKNAALEYGAQGIRVNTVSPGPIETEMFERFVGEENSESGKTARNSMSSEIALQRIGKDIEIAKAVVFLASDAASYITGTDLVVDGGYLAK